MLKEGARFAHQRIRDRGVVGLLEFAGMNISRRLPEPESTHVFEKEFDLLIILDGCRPDALYETIDVDTRATITSVGSKSDEWLRRTFNEPRSDTAYITANPFAESEINVELALIDQVWQYGWDKRLGTVPPSEVTDAAIRRGRNHQFDRTIVHYMQPHFPPLSSPELVELPDKNEFAGGRESVWSKVKSGDITLKKAWDLYLQNLERVWQEVEELLVNFQGEKAVISADHGNAFNEWWMLGHPHGVTHPAVREVPWYETTATDNGEREPIKRSRPDSMSIQERLEALGYQ